jgi:polysaccharide export outer membrane protein
MMKTLGDRHTNIGRTALTALMAGTLAACSSLGASGPTGSNVRGATGDSYAGAGIVVVELDDQAVQRTASLERSLTLAEFFGETPPVSTVIGTGDVLDVTIWEAPPAVLFGAAGVRGGLAGTSAQGMSVPPQIVDAAGTINVPFAGAIKAAGRTPAQIERDIVARLNGRAHQPQAMVRLAQNEARTVTIVGEVGASRRVPLSARGERLLDVLALAGGPRQPVAKTTVQLSRAGSTTSMPLEAIIRDPAQNIRVTPDDVVTVTFQPFSFIAMGAVSQNAEVPFEGAGLTVAQALGRIGGLRADQADISGIFIFRLEDPAALDPALVQGARLTQDGRVPVIYRLDLRQPASFFVAQSFRIRDDDVLYVSTAIGADLQRFISTVSSVAFSTISIGNAIN